MADGRQTHLILVDEIRASGLPRQTRLIVDHIARAIEVVVVAQCYLKPWHRARRLGVAADLYGFPEAGYERHVAAFAADLVGRHAPAWVAAYGWENAQLAVELDRLDVPVLAVIDAMAATPAAEGQIGKLSRVATEMIFADGSIPQNLRTAGWALEARAYGVAGPVTSRAAGAETRPSTGRSKGPPGTWRGWLEAWRRRPAAQPQLVADTICAAGPRCATTHAKGRRNRQHDHRLIQASGLFDAQLCRPLAPDGGRQEDELTTYLRASNLAIPRDRPFAGRLLRRPLAGFNPLIYATDNPSFDESTGEDPLAHFIRTGRPDGRWTHAVIRPHLDPPPPVGMTVAIHGHFHYPDMLPEFLDRLGSNRARAEVFLTTTSDGGRRAIEDILAKFGIEPKHVSVAPNRGRDVWPFLDLLRGGAFHGYDVVGHLHSKRSPHYDLGQVWKDFLWSHLVGGAHRAMDAILAAFASDPRLGLVFAEEPHLSGWELNVAPATALAIRAGIDLPLPNHFEFPAGTMFWATPDALDPLSTLDLTLDDMPEEPLPIDGTLLHALERLIPFLVAKAGFDYACVHVPGSVR